MNQDHHNTNKRLVMEKQLRSLILGVGELLLLVCFALLTNNKAVALLSRSSFPPGFIFGSGSGSYQYEGAANEGGRGPSIWDSYTHKHPERIIDGSNGDVALDEYHKYKEDVEIMKDTGLDAYRFSISWPRLLPSIKPFVTLFHWDLPQALEDEYGGFLSDQIVNHFRDYAELCYKEFGDRVKYWTTLNEPYTYSSNGYASGSYAPGRCSNWQKLNCTGGNSAIEPYLVTHHLLLAHAAAANLYKNKFQAYQKGVIGITLVSPWFVPLSEANEDKKAALRALEFTFGWFMEPLTCGDYPNNMQSIVGTRLPKFTKAQSKALIGSFDFLGLNYYTSYYASDASNNVYEHASYLTDVGVTLSSERNGVPIGAKGASSWLNVYPIGIQNLLLYTKEKYNDPIIYITENGIDEFNDPKLSLEEALYDTQRVDYHILHLYHVQTAIKNGVNVKGYFLWSLLDNFEWNEGFTVRFGTNYVDYNNGLKRLPKLSTRWFKSFLGRNEEAYYS
ncbi:beta-glucosidase 12-like isoform X2 [Prunus dulcis]|uniref:beta-glucosidase 12-like isoform X2 n=1 Tax=Prunus dulcis TaxID=3755 RepID=UPI00148203DA|nr:beta-glucosidase 12-like isoform X2 [Prunus dulcis]